MAGRADDLALELAERRVLFARNGDGRQRERKDECGEESHCSALRMPSASVCFVTAPGT